MSADQGSERRIAELEQMVRSAQRANASLRRTNERLARNDVVAQDSAAASIATKLDAADAKLKRMRSTLSWRLGALFHRRDHRGAGPLR